MKNKSFHIFFIFFSISFFWFSFSSCLVVKQAPQGKPFVYQSNIDISNNVSNGQKAILLPALYEQLDDSLKDRKVSKLLLKELKSPPVYDKINAENSLAFMKALLKSMGYFNDSIAYKDTIISKGNQQRATINFYVNPGKQVKVDTVIYTFDRPAIKQLIESNKDNAYIKKGDPFAVSAIAAERDRITDIMREQGYLKFGSERVVVYWDTLDVTLLQPSLDPFEQLVQLQKIKERQLNPKANLEYKLLEADSAVYQKYYVGKFTIYPDVVRDSASNKIIYTDTAGRITVLQNDFNFKERLFSKNIYLKRDSVYKQSNYLKTLNRFNALGPWSSVSIAQSVRKDTVDFIMRMIPSQKYNFNANLEGSQNQSALSSRFLGIGLATNLLNKNFRKAANLSQLNLRYGLELGRTEFGSFIQTRQFSAGYKVTIPNGVPALFFKNARYFNSLQTQLSTNFTISDRFNYFNLTTFNASWGYQYQLKNKTYIFKFPNFEYSKLIVKPYLDTLFKYNPALRNVFNDGFISSIIGGVNISTGTLQRPSFLKINYEQSGLITSIVKSKFLDSQMYRFIKLDADFSKLIKRAKSSIALRLFAGVGYELGSTVNPLKRDQLPFFKSFVAGGANSMRAWQLRKLGPGSTIKEFRGTNSFPDRFGDVQLEGNIEYRFPIGQVLSFPINGAVFTDMGNIWYLKNTPNRDPESVFSLSHFAKDIAIGSGIGLRIDASFLILRFDYAYKIKDPSPDPKFASIKNKWMGYKFFDGDQFQLGIGYPFIW